MSCFVNLRTLATMQTCQRAKECLSLGSFLPEFWPCQLLCLRMFKLYIQQNIGDF